jgi:hypothetical protein
VNISSPINWQTFWWGIVAAGVGLGSLTRLAAGQPHWSATIATLPMWGQFTMAVAAALAGLFAVIVGLWLTRWDFTARLAIGGIALVHSYAYLYAWLAYNTDSFWGAIVCAGVCGAVIAQPVMQLVVRRRAGR